MAENFQTADFILNKKKIFVFSIAFFFLLWKFFSLVIDSPLVLPSPESVAADFFSLAVEKNFLKSLAFTFFRVFCAFFISSFLGILFGFLCTSSFCFFPFSAKIAGFFAFLRAFFAFSHLFFLFLRIICIHFSCFNAFSCNYTPSGKYFLGCLHQSKNRLKTHL